MAAQGEQARSGWWDGPCGGREVLAIALPLAISTGSLSLMLFADRMFLLWHSAAEMGAAMPAGTLYWNLVCLPMGIAGYVNTFVAQYHGAGRPDRIGLVTWQGFRIGFYSVPLFLCVIPLTPWIFAAAGHESPIAEHETLYFQVLMFGGGACVMGEAFGAFFTGRGEMRLVMWVNIAASLLNSVLDYLWIFGYCGFPELGIEGAAWGTVVATWFKLAIYWWQMHRPEYLDEFQIIAGRRFNGQLLMRLIYYGSPSGLQYVVECGAFAIITLAMARFGETALAATTLAFNVNMVAFIPMVGVGIAASTLVGQQLTQGRPDLAARATWSAVTLALIYNAVFAVAYVAVPDWFILGHAAGVEAEHFAEIRSLTIVLLRFVAAYCLFDALQLLFAAAIKGAGDTWFVFANTTVVSTLVIGVGCIGSAWGGDLYWWWYVVTAWVCFLGVTYLARFLQGRWRHMRVIEHEEKGDFVPTESVPTGV